MADGPLSLGSIDSTVPDKKVGLIEELPCNKKAAKKLAAKIFKKILENLKYVRISHLAQDRHHHPNFHSR